MTEPQFVATTTLRFVDRVATFFDKPDGKQRILQQLFIEVLEYEEIVLHGRVARQEWRDVPLVAETP
jgi:hypothetical protein